MIGGYRAERASESLRRWAKRGERGGVGVAVLKDGVSGVAAVAVLKEASD